MYSHILLPVDLTGGNAAALQAVGELARSQDASITLLHVIEEIENGPSEELESFYAELTAKAEEVVGSWAEELAGQGLRVDMRVTRGRRVHEIIDYAGQQSCDLIVLATHRVDPGHPQGAFGTISHQVALMADCTVMLVR
ncbi:MAG: universal stress protein [Myxococcales bacterium]|jgi:nucleotide-binding universal stress UspA family protein